MSERFEISHQESVAETEPNLSQLKKEVEITPSTLKDITSKEQFLERVIELSANAKDSINIERAKQALVYLSQAEKILQYAASCGKTIDKYIIISVLHNEACCYQKIWELEKCSQYLQALIFNFNSFSKSTEEQQRHPKPKRDDRFSNDTIDCKTHLAKYYLQFCAVNSQTDNHSGALVAGRKSIEILRNIFKEMAQMAPSLKKGTYEKKAEFQYKIKLIDMASRLNDHLTVQHYESIFQAAKWYLRQWKLVKDSKDRPDRNYILEQQFKNYSIGNAMQIIATDYKQFQQKQPKTPSSKTVLQKILLMALGYFTISTQLRLIANKKYSKRDNQKHASHQYRQSQLYHLLSIIIASACIPFQILYIKHVLSSYNNHYGNDLLVDNQCSSTENHQELVFPSKSQKSNKDTITNSFSGSAQDSSLSKVQKQQSIHQQNSSNQAESQRERKRDQLSKIEDHFNDLSKKTKFSHKIKSKSKSKQLKSNTLLPTLDKQFRTPADKSEKASPMPKSPGIHLKSPKSNMIKVKTSYKLKVSAEKIITTNNLVKEDKVRKKKDGRRDSVQMDYFMGRSKDLKKMKKTVQCGLNMPSPRPNSRSSSRRQSPVPRYFDYLKQPPTPNTKQLKSPKRSSNMRSIKNSLQQHYL